MLKVLLIGSAGNIGVALAEYLRRGRNTVIEVDIQPNNKPNYFVADINHPLDLLSAFETKPDVVVLLAAMVSRVTCEQSGSLAIATNLGGLNNVIQLCKYYDCPLVYLSTSEVYGNTDKKMREDDKDLHPNNRYGLTKLIGEQLVEYEVREHRLAAITVRPFMIYCENETHGDHRSALIRFAVNIAAGKPIEVHEGSQRGWLHLDDAVAAFSRVIHMAAHFIGGRYEIFNIGNDSSWAMERVARMICREFDADESLIKIVPQPGRMTLRKCPDISKQKELLGITPKVGLREGIKRLCDHIKEEQGCK